eukprot:2353331-Pyramimonas_sp.AAC.1
MAELISNAIPIPHPKFQVDGLPLSETVFFWLLLHFVVGLAAPTSSRQICIGLDWHPWASMATDGDDNVEERGGMVDEERESFRRILSGAWCSLGHGDACQQ